MTPFNPGEHNDPLQFRRAYETPEFTLTSLSATAPTATPPTHGQAACPWGQAAARRACPAREEEKEVRPGLSDRRATSAAARRACPAPAATNTTKCDQRRAYGAGGDGSDGIS